MWSLIPNLTRYLAIGLGACLLLTLVLLNRAWTEVAEKTAVIESMHREAQAYKEKSEMTSKEIGDAFTTLVEQAKISAVANYKKRYGTGNAACGIRTDGLLTRHKDGVGETISTESTDGVPQSEFISACASDAAVIEQWQQWARLNQLPVE